VNDAEELEVAAEADTWSAEDQQGYDDATTQQKLDHIFADKHNFNYLISAEGGLR
jgi:hypothetical protein